MGKIFDIIGNFFLALFFVERRKQKKAAKAQQ